MVTACHCVGMRLADSAMACLKCMVAELPIHGHKKERPIIVGNRLVDLFEVVRVPPFVCCAMQPLSSGTLYGCGCIDVPAPCI